MKMDTRCFRQRFMLCWSYVVDRSIVMVVGVIVAGVMFTSRSPSPWRASCPYRADGQFSSRR